MQGVWCTRERWTMRGLRRTFPPIRWVRLNSDAQWDSCCWSQGWSCVTFLHLFRGIHPHSNSHTTSTEEPGSQGGMRSHTHNQAAHLHHVDSIMPLLSTLEWLLSKYTVPLFLPACVRSLCPQEACWSRNSELMTCSQRRAALMVSWCTPRTR